MLDMFKRADDPPEYYSYYAYPAALTMGLYGVGSMSGKFPEIDAAAATLSGLLCIGVYDDAEDLNCFFFSSSHTSVYFAQTF